MSTSRYFLAIPLPEAHRALIAKLRETMPGFSWTSSEKVHLTLRFLGEMEDEAVTGLEEALARIEVEPFILPLEGIGVFPPRGHPRVVWVGVGKGHPRLFQLRQRIDDNLLALGVEADLRTFHPHVTVARLRPESSPAAAALFVKKHRSFVGPPFRVDRFQLWSSQLQAGGSVYSEVADFPLLG